MKFTIHTMSHDQVIDLIRLLDKVDSSRTDEVKHLLKSAELGVNLTVDKVKRSRSRQQENYYRKWVNEFARWCGLTHDELHEELLCRAYGSEEINTKFGFKRRPIKRSSEANREKYSELIDTLIITAAEMGFAIPEPNDGD